MNFVAADLGASGTRYTSNNGKISVLPNNMMVLNTGETTNLEPNDEVIENNLEATIEKLEGETSFFPMTVLVGRMAERYYNNSNHIRPSISAHKHKQPINFVSSILAVAVAKITNGLDEDIVYVLDVPPVELQPAREVFKRELVGKYRVTFPKYAGGKIVTFNIVAVEAYAEAVMAITSFYFKMNGSLKEENKSYITGNVLSLDIGASTSDLAVVSNGEYLDMSGRTYKTGGNVARDTFLNLIRTDFEYELPIKDAEVAIAEGRLMLGNRCVDVSAYVTKAKQDLASKIVLNMQTYFAGIGIPIQSIRAVVVSGGGSVAGGYINDDGEFVKTSEPLSTYVTDELKKICVGVEAVPYGEDARFANVKGLYIRANLLLRKMGEKSQVSQAVAPQAVAQPVQHVVQAVAPQPVVNQTQAVAQAAVSQQAVAQPVTPTI